MVCILNLNIVYQYLVVHVTDNIRKNRTGSRTEEGRENEGMGLTTISKVYLI
jgi:hypothetical protein